MRCILKNIKSRKINLCYCNTIYITFNFRGAGEFDDFMMIFEQCLKPFFSVIQDADIIADYSISLINEKSNFNLEHADRVDFFIAKQDNYISDFSSGYMHKKAQGRVIFNPINGTIFDIENNNIDIYYLTYDTLLRDLQRVIKQLIVTNVENSGGFVLHASSFNYKGKAICFVGSKGMGKTTCLLEALNIEGATFISNDRLPIICRNNVFYACSWFEELRIIKDPCEKDKEIISPSSFFGYDKIQTFPVEISKIIFPNSTPSTLENLQSIISEQCLSPNDEQRPKWLGLSIGSDNTSFTNFSSRINSVEMKWQYSQLNTLKFRILELISDV